MQEENNIPFKNNKEENWEIKQTKERNQHHWIVIEIVSIKLIVNISSVDGV